MKNTMKKLLSLVLVAMLLVCAVPFQAAAAGTETVKVPVKVYIDGTLSTATKEISLNPGDTVTLNEKVALSLLTKNDKGFFLMVEGGRIDHALHDTNARKALQDTVAFDDAIARALDKMQAKDPGLKNTLVVVTADHDHTLVLNGYAARTGPTTASNPGVLGLLRNFVDGSLGTDLGGNPFTIIGFGNGENRANVRTALTDAQVADKNYHQEAVIPMAAGSETHGGTDVFLGATGKGADLFSGALTNTEVFGLIRKASGL